jgi:hypothetical protein
VVRWRFVGPDEVVAGWSERFAHREGAEAWLAESWSDLVERGIGHVELVDEATSDVLYRMSLAEG